MLNYILNIIREQMFYKLYIPWNNFLPDPVIAKGLKNQKQILIRIGTENTAVNIEIAPYVHA